ncbi:hypothetical protein M2169_002348 [Streptomyces sp. MJP52]|nr:hypothetical protein [Streptomyces sp. MJP52]
MRDPEVVVRAPGEPVGKDGVARLCDAARAGLDSGATVVICDVRAVRRPTLATVELVARLRLTARRGGGRVLLRGPDPALLALLDLVGLSVGVEMPGEAEQREEPRGVEEAVQRGDPPL